MLPFATFVYIVLSLLVSYVGMNRKTGFWGVLVLSLVFTPFLVFLMLLAFDKRPTRVKQPSSLNSRPG